MFEQRNRKHTLSRWRIALCIFAISFSLSFSRTAQAQSFCCGPDVINLGITAAQATASAISTAAILSAITAQTVVLRMGLSSINGTNTGIGFISLEKDKLLQKTLFNNNKQDQVVLVGGQQLARATLSEVSKACLEGALKQNALGAQAAATAQKQQILFTMAGRQGVGPSSNDQSAGSSRVRLEELKKFTPNYDSGKR